MAARDVINSQLLDRMFSEFKPRPFQQYVMDKVLTPADDRHIEFFVDKGNTGKTYVQRYLKLKYPKGICFITESTFKDVARAIIDYIKDGGKLMAVVCNIMKCQKLDETYAALESVKDGLLFSGKYDSGDAVFESPHVFVFMNEQPDQTKLTADRFIIHWINEKGEMLQKPPEEKIADCTDMQQTATPIQTQLVKIGFGKSAKMVERPTSNYDKEMCDEAYDRPEKTIKAQHPSTRRSKALDQDEVIAAQEKELAKYTKKSRKKARKNDDDDDEEEKLEN